MSLAAVCRPYTMDPSRLQPRQVAGSSWQGDAICIPSAVFCRTWHADVAQPHAIHASCCLTNPCFWQQESRFPVARIRVAFPACSPALLSCKSKNETQANPFLARACARARARAREFRTTRLPGFWIPFFRRQICKQCSISTSSMEARQGS